MWVTTGKNDSRSLNSYLKDGRNVNQKPKRHVNFPVSLGEELKGTNHPERGRGEVGGGETSGPCFYHLRGSRGV